ncbi:MAG: hypothetical protein ABWK01_07840 [Infirmifilum sp.]
MTVEYGLKQAGEKALEQLVDRLVEEARRRGLRASRGGVIQGIGFSLDAPYIIAEGLRNRGFIVEKEGEIVLTEYGEGLVEYTVEIAKTLKPYSLFPELDSGRLVGAILYALYDWSNSKTAEEILREASETLRLLRELQQKNRDVFKAIAVLLPRLYFESGKYTPLSLIEEIQATVS